MSTTSGITNPQNDGHHLYKQIPRDSLDEDRPHPESDEEEEEEGERRQDGVKQVEAITSAWTIRALILTYIFIYLVSFTNSLQQQITSNLAPYVTSSFSQHSLTATTSILSSIIGGVSRLPIAKILDIWGRIEGFVLMVFFCTVGLVLMASCQNVETYAAAQVFYWTGYNGMAYVISVFLADTTSLTNRMIVYGINSTPYIVNTFAGPAIAQLFLDHSNFRWAFGAFSIITPVIATPVTVMFIIYHHKAKKMGHIPEWKASGRTWRGSLYHYAREFDLIGMALIITGFSLLLLPLTLAASALNKWSSGYIIAMVVLGVVVLAAFGVWEKHFAPVTFLPFEYLKDRTVLGACILSGALFVGFYAWDIYFSSYLQVVNGLSVRDAGYILNIYNIGSCFVGPFVGLLIRRTGRFRWLALCAVPLSALSTALLIYFRHPGTHVGYIVMCQIFNALSGGTLAMTEQIAAMAAVPHNEVAVVLALEGLFSSLGGSIGQSISGTIWTNMMPKKLEEYLPQADKPNAGAIYGSLSKQLSYPMGSATRDAIIRAYGYVQRRMLIAGVSFMPLAFVCVLIWRDINVKNLKQTRGTVF